MSFAGTMRDRISRSFVESLFDNPVVAKELRTRMRGRKAFILMGIYTLVLTGILMIYAYFVWLEVQTRGSSLVNRNLGMSLFSWLNGWQTGLLTLVIPALTAGSLTGEIEGKTIEMLALTKLRPGKIVLGKILSGVLYSSVLLVASVPVAGICVMLGGISPSEVAASYGLLFGWIVLLSCMSVFWSSLFAKTAASTLLSYGFTLAYGIVTLIAGIQALDLYRYMRGGDTF